MRAAGGAMGAVNMRQRGSLKSSVWTESDDLDLNNTMSFIFAFFEPNSVSYVSHLSLLYLTDNIFFIFQPSKLSQSNQSTTLYLTAPFIQTSAIKGAYRS